MATKFKSPSNKKTDSFANIGIDAKLWLAADKLRNNMDAGEYKHVVLGRIYDPCCGSGGMFVQSEKLVETHGGKLGDISIYGQKSNPTRHRLAVMNLALRGIEANIGPEAPYAVRRDLHPDLRRNGSGRTLSRNTNAVT